MKLTIAQEKALLLIAKQGVVVAGGFVSTRVARALYKLGLIWCDGYDGRSFDCCGARLKPAGSFIAKQLARGKSYSRPATRYNSGIAATAGICPAAVR